jgi:CheY-like chemotaxis protein
MLTEPALERAYRVISAADELEAIGEASVSPPDLILLDSTTTRMNGHAVCQALLTTGGPIRSGLVSARAVP